MSDMRALRSAPGSFEASAVMVMVAFFPGFMVLVVGCGAHSFVGGVHAAYVQRRFSGIADLHCARHRALMREALRKSALGLSILSTGAFCSCLGVSLEKSSLTMAVRGSGHMVDDKRIGRHIERVGNKAVERTFVGTEVQYKRTLFARRYFRGATDASTYGGRLETEGDIESCELLYAFTKRVRSCPLSTSPIMAPPRSSRSHLEHSTGYCRPTLAAEPTTVPYTCSFWRESG